MVSRPVNLTPEQQAAYDNAERQRMQRPQPLPSPVPQPARPGRPMPLPGRTPNPFTVDRMPGGAPAGTGGQGRPMPLPTTGQPIFTRGGGAVDYDPKIYSPVNPLPGRNPDGSPIGTGGQGRPIGGGRTPNPFTVDAQPIGPGGMNPVPRPGMPGSATGARPNIGGMPGAIMKKGGVVKKAAGGKVAAKPVAKKAGGKVAAKPMGKPVMKKAGGRVAAKPMAKGRKK